MLARALVRTLRGALAVSQASARSASARHVSAASTEDEAAWWAGATPKQQRPQQLADQATAAPHAHTFQVQHLDRVDIELLHAIRQEHCLAPLICPWQPVCPCCYLARASLQGGLRIPLGPELIRVLLRWCSCRVACSPPASRHACSTTRFAPCARTESACRPCSSTTTTRRRCCE